jgi:uncharacterized protein YjbJ (UPF0337 family)
MNSYESDFEKNKFNANDLNNNGIDDSLELRARGNWSETKGKIRQQYANLTDDDLEYSEGKQEEWFGRLSKKLGRTMDDVKSWVSRL